MKVGFIGGGRMAEAIIGGLISSETLAASDIYVSDISNDRRNLLNTKYGINVFDNNSLVLKHVEILFLAVKPQILDSVLDELSGNVPDGMMVISIAAGKTLAGLTSHLPSARVVRVMPNLAVLVSQGMSVFCTKASLTIEERKTITTLLSSSGKVIELPEEHFDAVTALSGSGPAFFAHYLSVITEESVKLGLPAKAAVQLALQTMLGTATLLDKGIFSNPQELLKAVSSKGGTTASGLDVLTQPQLTKIVSETLHAAAKRSAELSSC